MNSKESLANKKDKKELFDMPETICQYIKWVFVIKWYLSNIFRSNLSQWYLFIFGWFEDYLIYQQKQILILDAMKKYHNIERCFSNSVKETL